MQKQLPLLLVLSLLFAAASSDSSIRKIGGGHDLPVQDAQDTGTEAPPTPADIGAPATSPVSASQYVHRIDAANHAGSCVCIAPGVFITAKHIFEGLSGYQVSIDGQAVAASVTFAPAHDVAIVSLTSETAAAPVEIGDADYMAECTAYGIFSATEHAGIVSNNDTLSLTSDAEIAQGDSGGGVFSNGKLIGVIRGKNPQNGRVCYFTPLSEVMALVAPFSRGESANQPPGAESTRTYTAQEYIDGEFVSPRILKFEARWCGACKSREIVDWVLDSGWAVEYIDVDERPEVMQAFGVTSIPTYVVICRGKEAGRYTGLSREKFRPILEKAVQ